MLTLMLSLNLFKELEALIYGVADREGFEPSLPFGKHAFQACAIDHSATCPCSTKTLIPLVKRDGSLPALAESAS